MDISHINVIVLSVTLSTNEKKKNKELKKNINKHMQN